MQNKKLVLISLILLGIIVVLSVIGYYLQNTDSSNNLSANLIVSVLGYKKADNYQGEQITALALLKEYNSVNTSFSSYGEFVECINEVCSDTISNHYWMYYINGNMASLGAGSYYLNNNDTIEFRYE